MRSKILSLIGPDPLIDASTRFSRDRFLSFSARGRVPRPPISPRPPSPCSCPPCLGGEQGSNLSWLVHQVGATGGDLGAQEFSCLPEKSILPTFYCPKSIVHNLTLVGANDNSNSKIHIKFFLMVPQPEGPWGVVLEAQFIFSVGSLTFAKPLFIPKP